MNRISLRSLGLLFTIVLLSLSLAGCETMDYRKAIRLYNRGDYQNAQQIFADLGTYQESENLALDCRYRTAVLKMTALQYSQALEQFTALGNYLDAPQRVLECQYQIAISLLDSGDLAQAQAAFTALSDYRQSREYLRRIAWQNFFNQLKTSGTGKDGGFWLEWEDDGCLFQIGARPGTPDQLLFSLSRHRDAGYRFADSLTLTLTRDSLLAEYAAESRFEIDLSATQPGSVQTAGGKADISQCFPGMELTPETYEKTVTTPQGNTVSSSDPAKNAMADTMKEDLSLLLTALSHLPDAITTPVQAIGFSLLG